MNTDEKKNNFHENWWWRRLIYVIVAAVGVILTGFGIVDAGQFDVIEASPLLATAVGVLAAMFTGTGSDSRAKDSELAEARLDRRDFEDNLATLQGQIQQQVSNALDLLPDRVQEAVRALYEQPYGDHELTGPAVDLPPEPGPDPVSDVVEYYRRASGWGRVDGEE